MLPSALSPQGRSAAHTTHNGVTFSGKRVGRGRYPLSGHLQPFGWCDSATVQRSSLFASGRATFETLSDAPSGRARPPGRPAGPRDLHLRPDLTRSGRAAPRAAVRPASAIFTGAGAARRPPAPAGPVPAGTGGADTIDPGPRGHHTFGRDRRRPACRPGGREPKITTVLRVTATTGYSVTSPPSHPADAVPAQEKVNYTGVIRRSVIALGQRGGRRHSVPPKRSSGPLRTTSRTIRPRRDRRRATVRP